MQIRMKEVIGVRHAAGTSITGDLGITMSGVLVGLTREYDDCAVPQFYFLAHQGRTSRWRRWHRYLRILSLQQIQDMSALRAIAGVD